MPTNYVGDKTHTQAPSQIPQNEGTITAALPADGDFPNASLYAQAYKVCADWIAWLVAPAVKAAASAADWARSLIRFRAANGHTRFHIDHLALPAGRIQHWREGWETIGSVGGTVGPADINTSLALATLKSYLVGASNYLFAAAVAANLADTQTQLGLVASQMFGAGAALDAVQGFSQWRARTHQTTGSSNVAIYPPDSGTVTSRHRYLGLSAGDGLNDYANVWRVCNAHFDNNLTIAIEWELQLESTGMGGKLSADVGLCEENAMPTPFGTANNFAVFEVTAASGNWFARTAAGGVVTGTDTGVAATTGWVRFRLELHGSTVADDTTRAVRYYINGALVVTHTTNIPAVAAVLSPVACVVNYQGGAAGLGIPVRLGPMRGASNIYGADVT